METFHTFFNINIYKEAIIIKEEKDKKNYNKCNSYEPGAKVVNGNNCLWNTCGNCSGKTCSNLKN